MKIRIEQYKTGIFTKYIKHHKQKNGEESEIQLIGRKRIKHQLIHAMT